MKIKPNQLRALAWMLSALVSAVAIFVWGQGLQWHFSNLSSYKFFPLLGLLAFSLMWAMVVIRFFRMRWGFKASDVSSYYKPISFIVIFLIISHPGLLVWQLFRDGFGLPPGSYLQHFVAPGLRWAATLGTIAFLIFLTYELRYKYRSRTWWKYIENAQAVALLAIIIHGLKLGTNLQHGWFRLVWYFYGVVLGLVLLDFYSPKLKKLDLKSKKTV